LLQEAPASRGIQLNSAAVNAEKARRAALIQSEEKKLMKYEDERRRRYLRLQKANPQKNGLGSTQQAHVAQQMGSSTQSARGPSGRQQAPTMNSYGTTVPSENEVQAAYLWLSSPRPLILGGRVKKEYIWRVVSDLTTAHTSADSAREKASVSYILQWFDPLSQQQPAGSINLSDCKDISLVVTNNSSNSNPSMNTSAIGIPSSPTPNSTAAVTIVLTESAKAIRSSGGRTSVSLECSSMNEAMQYRNTLQTLRTACSLGV
jgi:hypothetical protein